MNILAYALTATKGKGPPPGAERLQKEFFAWTIPNLLPQSPAVNAGSGFRQRQGNNMDDRQRLGFTVSGQVQGVGFRPFVWRLARECGLAGFARNTSAGLAIEVEGAADSLAQFERRLQAEKPPLAMIAGLQKEKLPCRPGQDDFRILQSLAHGGQNVLVSPDVGTCGECLADIRDPQNRRHGYAFANCTNCGPRYSITRGLPYDRPLTTMACFELCDQCRAEYESPQDRRFHAQPIACAACGPRLVFADKNGPCPDPPDEALLRACRILREGGIVAIKGLGGFQLACDARDPAAVAELRRRKNRPRKALAVMTGDLDAARLFCSPGPAHAELLLSPARPITLCPARGDEKLPLCWSIAPDNTQIGVMLPSTPLHALLLDELARQGMTAPALVMTSANPAGEPICLGNREALSRLANLADGWLLHDRDILVRVDDSVVGLRQDGTPYFIRRARGYVPRPLALADDLSGILGAGAHLKATFTITRGNSAFASQHIGDLDSPAAMRFYEETLAHLSALLETGPRALIHDLHPDFPSTIFAREYAKKHGLPLAPLQHHAAHAAAVLGENHCLEPALAICLDGSGHGGDGSVWGGEFIHMDLGNARWRRVGSFAPLPLPGGEAAIREPWRIACALSGQSGPFWSEKERAIIGQMVKKGLNCPPTSSCGRLFDAISAILGICGQTTYEGQAAILLETEALHWLRANPGPRPPDIFAANIVEAEGMLLADSPAWCVQAGRALRSGLERGAIAAAFHLALADSLAQMACSLAGSLRLRMIGLSGGVMLNSLLYSRLAGRIREAGFRLLEHRQSGPGDGSVSLGQAIWGQRLAITGALKI